MIYNKLVFIRMLRPVDRQSNLLKTKHSESSKTLVFKLQPMNDMQPSRPIRAVLRQTFECAP